MSRAGAHPSEMAAHLLELEAARSGAGRTVTKRASQVFSVDDDFVTVVIFDVELRAGNQTMYERRVAVGIGKPPTIGVSHPVSHRWEPPLTAECACSRAGVAPDDQCIAEVPCR